MKGDIVFRVYGLHASREEDMPFGAFRTRAEADARIAKLAGRDEGDWARRYHDRGFVVREHVVDTDFEIPSRLPLRERYVVSTSPISRPPSWDSTRVEVIRREGDERVKVTEYVRNYAMLSTFEPFRQGDRELALVSRDYTATAVLDLASGQVIAEEPPRSGGFCPVGYHVPDWWDVHDGSIIPGSEAWNADHEWPTGTFGFVWGCVWGDDTSWKVQYLDLSRVTDGVIARDERFGYVRLATSSGRPSDFIAVQRFDGKTSVRFAVEETFDLETGVRDD